MYNGELNCMGTVRRGTKRDWTFVSLQVTSLSLVSSSHSGISLSVLYQIGLVACAIVKYVLLLEFALFLPNSWKLHGTDLILNSEFVETFCFQQGPVQAPLTVPRAP